jgi:[ribosomal protein S18]-alanine N-acetyltransferase
MNDVLHATRIRWLVRGDMPEVEAIERATFTEPWADEDYVRVLRDQNVIGMAAEDPDERVAGVMVYELQKLRLVLLRIMVRPDRRLQGVGRAMLDKLHSKLSAHRRNRVALDVPDDLLGAHLWLRACGFEAVRVDGDNYRFVRRLA